MTKSKNQLFASAHTLSAMTECVMEFYGGQAMRLEDDGARQWKVMRVSDSKHIEGCRVVLKGSRFRFERVLP